MLLRSNKIRNTIAAIDQKSGQKQKESEVLDEDDEFELPVLTVDGQDFLYDVDGEYDGTQNLLFSMDGEPYGVYDPETKTARKLTE